MHIKTLLILLFMLVALIPTSLLSVNATFSLLRLEEQISNIYIGVVSIIVKLGEGSDILLTIRSDVGRYLISDSQSQRLDLEEQIQRNEQMFLQNLVEYQKIVDFPLQVDILKSKGMDYLIPYEDNLLRQVHNDWLLYQIQKDKVISLSSSGNLSEAMLANNGPATDSFDQLINSYKKIIDLNNDLARLMYTESQSVVRTAFAFSIISAIASVAAALAVAFMLSKRLAPSIEEIRKNAKKTIDKFLKEKSEVLDEKPPSAIDDILKTDRQIPENIMLEKGPLVLFNLAGYYSKDKNDRSALMLDSLLNSYLPTIDSKKSNSKRNLVVITRKSSNLYAKVYNKGAMIYLLSASTESPISTSEDGLLVISISQISIILEAIRRTLEEDPSAIILLDNITELIHKIGFEKVFSLVHNISDVASSYQYCRIVLIINKNAHETPDIEALANITNTFIQ